ncbi:glycosyltransferase family 4 protein [Candidatus Binatia bacterium]|nr:glycosyltransferase family 4 protein [Candidatus Binatia bacterium]
MKIALACESFVARSGGAAQWQRAVAKRLAERGHEIVVLTFAPPRAVPSASDTRPVQSDDGDPAGVAVRRLAWHPSRLARARAMTAAVGACAADVAHDTGVGFAFDVFHPQMGPRLANYRRDMASRTPGERVCERLRPRHWRWLAELRHVERRQHAHRSALFVAVSKLVASSMQRLYGVRPERIRIVANGADLAALPAPDASERTGLRHRLGAGADRTLFLFAAHNARLKGVRPLLEAASLLRRSGAPFRLALIGGAVDPDVRQRIARLGLQDVVTACGFVPDAAAHYAAADVLVLPSYHDACSLTVFEACAYGLPVITTRYNGASEHLANGREGFIVDEPDDVIALARRMDELTDAAVRRRMSANARVLARRHDLERNAVELEAVLREAVERRACARGVASRRGAWRGGPP